MDTATALLWLATTHAIHRFLSGPGRRTFVALAVIVALFAATRFTAVLVLPLFLTLALVHLVLRGREGWRRWLAATTALVPVIGVAWVLSYGADLPSRPLGQVAWRSEQFQRLAQQFPAARLPLPDRLLAGLDKQARDSQPGSLTTMLEGRVTAGRVPQYFPVAIAWKWPLGVLILLALSATWTLRRRGFDTVLWVLPMAMLVYLSAAMFGNLNAGVRYVLPLLPLLCVWSAALVAPSAPRWLRRVALAAGAASMIESGTSLSYPIAHFQPFAGGVTRAQFRLNDSNVDWGQGLIALREECERRGIRSLRHALHGTTDPGIYGVPGTPILNGGLDPDDEWFAVSSYFFVGLPARTMTATGYSASPRRFDLRSFWNRVPDATVGGSIHLFRLR